MSLMSFTSADRLARLIALVTLATLAIRYDVAVFLIDYVATPIHSGMLLLIALIYLGFGIQAVIGLWIGRKWGNWGYYLHVLTGTIHFSYSVLPFSPGFESDYLYYAWFLGGNALACLAVMAIGSARERHGSGQG